MLGLKTKAEFAKDAHTLAVGNAMVRYRGTTYMPEDYETGDTAVAPDPERSVWRPLSREDIQQLGASMFDALFANDGELRNFDFMVAQNATLVKGFPTTLLVRTPQGLKQLASNGKLIDTTGDFVPNTLEPELNDDPVEKERVFDVISEWVGGDEEAHSLLYHLATSLAPHWSAVKYVLLLGEGRNGKGVLLKMLRSLYGQGNISHVTRQHISESSTAVADLNGKLMNLVFDGPAAYLKDSGLEKTLVAGEPAPIKVLYESSPTLVQTNALFVEALNREPKSNDKSSALQKRLVRFQFSNIYALDYAFEKSMLSEKSMGAFLALLIDHYVTQDQVAEKLQLTSASVALQLEHTYTNSLALQYLKYIEEKELMGASTLLGEPVTVLVQGFQSWRVQNNELTNWSEPDVINLFAPLVVTERKTVRTANGPRKVRVVTMLKAEAEQFLKSLEGDLEDDDIEALVAD